MLFMPNDRPAPLTPLTVVSLFALFNGISCPLLDWLRDRLKSHYVAIAPPACFQPARLGGKPITLS
jgi:hypothetical protein